MLRMTTSKHLYFVVCVDIEGLVPITRWCIDYHIGLEIKSVTMFSYPHCFQETTTTTIICYVLSMA